MRKRGYYWVRYKEFWYIAYYNGDWRIAEFDLYFDDAAFDEIDEKRIERADPVKEDKSDNLINQFAC